jgi:hypothetical protein
MTRPDPRGFAQRMKDLGDAIEAGTRQLANDVADAVQQHLIEATPVSHLETGHSGRARNNWVATINSPSSRVDYDGPFDPTGRSQVEINKTVIENNKRGRPVYIANNLNYIGLLNDGFSSQAPEGFVQAAMLIGIRRAKSASILGYARVNLRRSAKETTRFIVHSKSPVV